MPVSIFTPWDEYQGITVFKLRPLVNENLCRHEVQIINKKEFFL
jgi:hypothetical protein